MAVGKSADAKCNDVNINHVVNLRWTFPALIRKPLRLADLLSSDAAPNSHNDSIHPGSSDISLSILFEFDSYRVLSPY